jgi:4-diphosphocytidyl-2-C-methyl-D-erythritol kinase
MELVKRIPAAAGLGGGSSDAAAALRLANSAWELNWPIVRLAEVAAAIGSDVPFFLSSGPAICRGRGERVDRVPGMRQLHLVVVKPPIGLSTADVYRAHDASISSSQEPGAVERPISSWARDGRAEVGRWMRNRLQSAAAAVSPWIDRLQAVFEKLDFLSHQLSGSGSAYFGVCRHAQHARRLATILRTQRLGIVYATRSCT